MRQQGFTLAEALLVLIVIAVLLAAVLQAADLMNSSRINSIATDVQKFKSAVTRFDSKYHYLPGDILDADRYFSGTVDGDGDEQIEWGATGGENLRAWQHLSLSGFLKEEYSGVRADNTPDAILMGRHDGTDNIPVSQIKVSARGQGGYWMTYNDDNTLPSTTNRRLGNFIMFGTRPGVSGAQSLRGVISPLDAISLDEKIDDRQAESGSVLALDAAGESNCVNANDYYIASANADREEPVCMLWFAID